MMFEKSIKLGFAALALGLGVTVAQAAPITFFGNLPKAAGAFPTDPNSAPLVQLAAFNAAVDVTASESFETRTTGLLAGAAYNFSNTMSVLGTGSTLTQAAPAGFLQGARVRSGTQFSGRFNTTGGASSGQWIETDSNFTVDLATSVDAFGFFGTDFGDFDGSLSIALYNVVNGVQTLVQSNVFVDGAGDPIDPAGDNGSLLFFGFGSDLVFNRIVFTVGQGTGPLDYLGFDDIIVGNLRDIPPGSVPEPGSLALAGLALVAAGWARQAQRRA